MFSATGAVSPEDIERYKAQFSEPGALTAALNYYRAMVRMCFLLPLVPAAIALHQYEHSHRSAHVGCGQAG